MALLWSFFVVFVSAVAVILTADFAIKSSLKLALRFGLSEELIGMTILSIGTSMPEIITHIVASIKILQDKALMNELSGLVIGTNIGSDIFQQNFIIGLVGLIGVLVIHKKHIFKDVGGLIAAAVLVLVFSYNGVISRFEGFLLLLLYAVYLFVLKKYGMEEDGVKEMADKKGLVANNIIIVVLSFAVMTFAADRMLFHSEILVQALPISASFFGVILLGVAAAFPELTTSLIAVFKKKGKISAGILIGSNITNPMFALGLGALISTYTVPGVTVVFDLPFKIATALLLLYFLHKGKLKKTHAAILIALYVVFLVVRRLYFPADIF